mmetsp:Transcript_24405/g.52622  ORF Transcript_24405/g.52622 Transcript_24405/m.52622 type:complete len:264 (+) Transcript_24405:850-1641(+)
MLIDVGKTMMMMMMGVTKRKRGGIIQKRPSPKNIGVANEDDAIDHLLIHLNLTRRRLRRKDGIVVRVGGIVENTVVATTVVKGRAAVTDDPTMKMVIMIIVGRITTRQCIIVVAVVEAGVSIANTAAMTVVVIMMVMVAEKTIVGMTNDRTIDAAGVATVEAEATVQGERMVIIAINLHLAAGAGRTTMGAREEKGIIPIMVDPMTRGIMVRRITKKERMADMEWTMLVMTSQNSRRHPPMTKTATMPIKARKQRDMVSLARH